MKSVLILAALAGAASMANAAVIANWTFESSIPSGWTNTGGATGNTPGITFAAEVGSGTASARHNTAATVWSGPAGNGSVRALSSNNWTVGDYYQFAVSTVGFTGITIQFDANGSGTGPRDFKVQYSTNGTTFTDVTTYAIPSGITWNTTTSNPSSTFGAFALPVGAENASSLFVRLVGAGTTSISGGTVGTGGTSRVDNVTISGVVPTPGALALLGLGGLVAGRRRRA